MNALLKRVRARLPFFKRIKTVNTVDVAAIVAELLPVATELVTVIEKIRAQSPDAWAAVSAQYGDAVAAWDAAKNATPPAPAVAIAQAAQEIVADELAPTITPENAGAVASAIVAAAPSEHPVGVPKRVGT